MDKFYNKKKESLDFSKIPKDVYDTDYDGQPVIEKAFTPEELEDPSEYGYGFWMRFLTDYPRRLISGKNAPWYFLSRLTRNIPHQDIGMGDRTLAIW